MRPTVRVRKPRSGGHVVIEVVGCGNQHLRLYVGDSADIMHVFVTRDDTVALETDEEPRDAIAARFMEKDL